MKRLSFAAASLAALVMPQMAIAQTASPAASSGIGFYVEGQLGLTLLDDYDLDSDIDVLDIEVSNEIGANILGALGVSLPLGPLDLRVEGEVGYRGNPSDEFDNVVLGEGDSVDSSATTALSGMANGHVDFRITPQFALTAGAGVGYAKVTADLTGDFDGDDLLVVDNESDTVIAYQLMTGVRYDISTHLVLSLGYRYFVTDDPKFEIPGVDGEDYDAEYLTHNFNLGLGYKF